MKKYKLACLKEKEELLARKKAKGKLIRNVEKEIYENVNQVLCLARISLANLDCNDRNRSTEIAKQSGNLIGKSICDLRNLANQAKNVTGSGKQ